MEVIEELVDKLCPTDCIYRIRFTPTTDCCAYCLFKKQSRGCRISECDKYRRGKRRVVMELGTLEFRWVEDERD